MGNDFRHYTMESTDFRRMQSDTHPREDKDKVQQNVKYHFNIYLHLIKFSILKNFYLGDFKSLAGWPCVLEPVIGGLE